MSTTEFPATRNPVPDTPATPPTASLWWVRLWVIIRVAFFIELGMIVAVLPWTRGWTENNLLLAHPELRFMLQNHFLRGLISGLGFLDIGFGIWEAISYKEAPARQKRP